MTDCFDGIYLVPGYFVDGLLCRGFFVEAILLELSYLDYFDGAILSQAIWGRGYFVVSYFDG